MTSAKAAGEVEDYSAKVVHRHEQTLSKPKSDRLNLLRATRAHFGQIFMLYSDPALTAEKFIPDPFSSDSAARMYKTGDLGRHLSDGRIEFLGRADNQVKVRGFRIELGDIEAALSAHPTVKEAVVVAREDRPGDKRLVAYVIAGVQGINVRELRNHLKDVLPEYMVPATFVALQSFPLNANGKVDRRALPAPDVRDRVSESDLILPRTPTEGILAEIWAEVMELDKIGVTDNFFDLGNGDQGQPTHFLAGNGNHAPTNCTISTSRPSQSDTSACSRSAERGRPEKKPE